MAVKEPLQIIVADDEQDTVTTLAAVLEDAGYKAFEATRGAEVIAEARKRKPDALVLDIDMPGMSGYTVAREIREIYEHSTPLLIAISGKYVGQTDKMLADLAGFTHFLQKPCDPAVLLRLLEPVALVKQALPEAELTLPPLPDTGR